MGGSPPPPHLQQSLSRYFDPDGRQIPYCEIMRISPIALVLRRGDLVLKIPTIEDCSETGSEHEAFTQEKAIYDRLEQHEGIVSTYKTSPIIEMPYLCKQDLSIYMKSNTQIPETRIARWIREIVDALCYIHQRKVLVYDMSLMNILVDDDLSLKWVDFGDSIQLPVDAEMSSTSERGVSVKTDIFSLGWLIYSILKREPCGYDLFPDNEDEPSWPQEEQLPEVERVWYAEVIRKCWLRVYQNTEEVRCNLDQALQLFDRLG